MQEMERRERDAFKKKEKQDPIATKKKRVMKCKPQPPPQAEEVNV
jgi:hypothetical protein